MRWRTANHRAKNHWRKAVRREWRQGCDDLLTSCNRMTDSIPLLTAALRNLANTRLPVLFPDDRVTVTGRWSGHRLVPQRLFEPGGVVLSPAYAKRLADVDYASIERRILAHFNTPSGKSEMTSNEEHDEPESETTKGLFELAMRLLEDSPPKVLIVIGKAFPAGLVRKADCVDEVFYMVNPETLKAIPERKAKMTATAPFPVLGDPWGLPVFDLDPPADETADAFVRRNAERQRIYDKILACQQADLKLNSIFGEPARDR